MVAVVRAGGGLMVAMVRAGAYCTVDIAGGLLTLGAGLEPIPP
jgi:hypothetical protein